MASGFFRIISVVLYVIAALIWLILGLQSPAGVNQAGMPLDEALYNEVGSFMYWLLGSAFLIPVFLVAGIGWLFGLLSSRLEK
jgi:hypothetical protein